MQILADGMRGGLTCDSLTPQRRATLRRSVTSMRALSHADDPFPGLARSAAAAIGIPALLMQGEFASAWHRRVIEELAHTVPGAIDHVIRAAGHGSPFENPGSGSEVRPRLRRLQLRLVH